MEGHSHALSGACTGLAAGILLHLPASSDAILAGFTAGFATMPDMDKTGSCAARSLGPLSELLAWTIGKLSGGHRHLTHAALGVAVFTAFAWTACLFRSDLGGKIGLMLFLSLALAAALSALHVAKGVLGDLLGIAAAAAVTFYGLGLALVPLACALGWATHITGDLCTDSGVRILYPFSGRKFHLLPEPAAFTTGTGPETRIVDPLLSVALVILAAWVIDPAADRAAWAYLAHLAGHL
jgi:membrane-bound metal-dependent hydrolase YbcI (DUF457 family)